MSKAENTFDSLGETLHLIVVNIHQLSGAYHQRLQAWTRKVGLTAPQWELMFAAAGENRTVPQLARRMRLARQTVQRSADQIVRIGMASFRPNPDHQRSPYFVLSEEGRKALATIEGAMREQRGKYLEQNRVSRRDLEVTQRVLESMQKFVDSTPPWK